MITSIIPPKVQILVGAACLVWIAVFSACFVNFSGLAVSNGWLIALALIFASSAWVLVMIREIRDAEELPDPFDHSGHDGVRQQSERFSAVSHGERWIPTEVPARRRPRKARSSRIESTLHHKSSDIFHPDV